MTTNMKLLTILGVTSAVLIFEAHEVIELSKDKAINYEHIKLMKSLVNVSDDLHKKIIVEKENILSEMEKRRMSI